MHRESFIKVPASFIKSGQMEVICEEQNENGSKKTSPNNEAR
jgi:hypothetical protein